MSELSPSEIWQMRTHLDQLDTGSCERWFCAFQPEYLIAGRLFERFAQPRKVEFRREQWVCRGQHYRKVGSWRVPDEAPITFWFWRAELPQDDKTKPICPRCWTDQLVPWLAHLGWAFREIGLEYGRDLYLSRLAYLSDQVGGAASRARTEASRGRYRGNAQDRRRQRRVRIRELTLRYRSEAQKDLVRFRATWEEAYGP